MLEFAEDLDQCRKIQFAKFVCPLKPRIDDGDYRNDQLVSVYISHTCTALYLMDERRRT